jgi:hypothetical protein
MSICALRMTPSTVLDEWLGRRPSDVMRAPLSKRDPSGSRFRVSQRFDEADNEHHDLRTRCESLRSHVLLV